MLKLQISSLCSWWDARPFLTLSATILGVLLLLNIIKKSKNSVGKLPPGPRGLPVVGYLPFLGTFLHKKFTELAGVYGPIYKLWLGNKLCIVISSPSLVKEVLRDKDKIFANRDIPTSARVITYGANDIAWIDYGPEWKKLRKVFVREMISKSSIDACYSLRKQEVHKAIKHVYNRSGSPIDFGELVFEITTNSVISMLCGGMLKGEKAIKFMAEFRKLAQEVMVVLAKPNVSDIFPVLARLDLQGIEKQTRRIHSYFDQIFDSVIEQRLNESTEENEGIRKDFLQILLDYNSQEDANTSITMNQLKAMLMDIVLGGTDTTATTLEWIMAEIMLNQEVMKKLYQELDQVVGINNVLEEFHLPGLQYLEAVCKEANRLHPALPLLVPHVSGQSCTIGGYTIPKGSTVFLNVYAIQRDPLYWDNPLEFRPERFLNTEGSKYDYSGNNFQYLPFGSGRRVCAGLPLAERTLTYVLASLLHSFEWELPQGAELELSDKFGIVIKKMKPLILVATPRLSNGEIY